jgi:hypothetical protein
VGTIFTEGAETFRMSDAGDGLLYARVINTAGATAGEADIYVLIATPS